MRIPSARQNGDAFQLRMTPMIDVVFLLLIFFVTTASFQAREERLPANLDQPGNAPVEVREMEPDLEQIVVRLSWSNDQPQWTVNGQPQASLSEVQAVLTRIASIQPDLPVVLDVGGDVPLGHMIEVYDAARLAGLERIRFAVEPQP